MSTNSNEVVEGNKLIAEFMGGKFRLGWAGNDGYNLPKNLRAYHNAGSEWWATDALDYHRSWDWLIPVCFKIDRITENNKFPHSKQYEQFCDDIDDAVSCYEIKPAWRKVIQFINWYNKNNKL